MASFGIDLLMCHCCKGVSANWGKCNALHAQDSRFNPQHLQLKGPPEGGQENAPA